ncbi:MAG: protein kinase [Microcoleaceae cyanobacterium]
MVQEFIPGYNLTQELARQGSFDESKIRQVLQEILPVLDFIHRHQVIHRDIKPDNIIRRRSPVTAMHQRLTLVDFGSAKSVTQSQQQQLGTMIGSAAYTAPEQLMGKATFASDIYSLGVTCIHLLTGIPPFDLFESQTGEWAWRDYLKAPLSDELSQILDRMLQRAVGQRYQSATAVLRYLEPYPKYIGILPGLMKLEPDAKPKSDKSSAEKPAEHFDRSFDRNFDKNCARNFAEHFDQQSNGAEIIKARRQFQGQFRDQPIETILQGLAVDYGVTLQVSQLKKHQLNVVINRSTQTKVNYHKLSRRITYELTLLQLKLIHRVKILGRVEGESVPEWQKTLKIDRKVQFRNYLVRLQHHPQYHNLRGAIAQFTDQEFWLTLIRRKSFWVDTLMLAMIIFIFSQNIIVLTPFTALVIAPALYLTKRQLTKTQALNVNTLFGTVTALFISLESLNVRIWAEGLFGMILMGLLIAMPIFYGQGES